MSFERKHLKCILWKLFWTLAFIAFVLAWVGARSTTGTVFTLDAGLLLWSALVLGVLAIPIKLDCADCGKCSIKR